VQTLDTSLLDVPTRQMSVSVRISFVVLFFGESLVDLWLGFWALGYVDL
jgi:hypothetical protein